MISKTTYFNWSFAVLCLALTDAAFAFQPATREINESEVAPDQPPYILALAEYGQWIQHKRHGLVWYPIVQLNNSPYRGFSWHYTGYGYPCVSHVPWGWVPHRYGRWYQDHRGWFWTPSHSVSLSWHSFTLGARWFGRSNFRHTNNSFAFYTANYQYHFSGGHHTKATRYMQLRGRKATPRTPPKKRRTMRIRTKRTHNSQAHVKRYKQGNTITRINNPIKSRIHILRRDSVSQTKLLSNGMRRQRIAKKTTVRQSEPNVKRTKNISSVHSNRRAVRKRTAR